MTIAERLVQSYFNVVYTPLYDSTVGGLSAYRDLQQRCIQQLDLQDGDRVLCVGVGTGNEISHILNVGRRVEIVGIDISENALVRAYRKALRTGTHVGLFKMDARRLEFPSETFDKVVCIHVTDWIVDSEQLTAEVLRVLKKGGTFAITYPAEKEGTKLGANVLMEDLRQDLGARRVGRALRRVLGLAGLSLVYLPFLFRPKQRVYAPAEIRRMLTDFGVRYFRLERNDVYLDLIISGQKEGATKRDQARQTSGGLVLLQPERGRDLAPVLRVH